MMMFEYMLVVIKVTKTLGNLYKFGDKHCKVEDQRKNTQLRTLSTWIRCNQNVDEEMENLTLLRLTT